jgi:hypothetical protein
LCRCTEDPDWTLGGTAREGAAHVEHIVHVRISGRVETQRLVERRRLLPRVTPRHMRRATQGGGRREGVWGACGGGGGARSVHGGADWTLGTRTFNIKPMFVTLDVSRLSGWLNAEAPCRVTRRHMEGDTPGEGVGAETVNAACTEGPPRHWRGGAPQTCWPCP